MPDLLDDEDMEQHTLPNSHYGYSSVAIEDLGATEYTIVTIVVDDSSSTDGFQREMERVIREVVEACKKDSRADYILLRITSFATGLTQVHGFKMLDQCNPADYTNFLNSYGSTALYGATVESCEALADFADTLGQNDFQVNGLLVVITDGEENASRGVTINDVKTAMKKPVKAEKIQGMTSILVGVGSGMTQYLQKFKDDVGFDSFVEIKNADKNSLAKLANFISKSVKSSSQSLSNKTPSVPIAPSLTI